MDQRSEGRSTRYRSEGEGGRAFPGGALLGSDIAGRGLVRIAFVRTALVLVGGVSDGVALGVVAVV